MLLFFFVLCLVRSFSQTTSDVPLFVWSGEGSYLRGKNVGLSSALSPPDIESLFQSIIQGTTAPTVFSTVLSSSATRRPEAFVVFLEPKLCLDQVSTHSAQLVHLKSLMQSSSSFYAPYVDFSESLASALVYAAKLTKQNGSTTYSGKGDTLLPELRLSVPNINAVSLKMLQNTLLSSNIFANQHVDLIIVHLDRDNVQDRRFGITDEVIKSVIDIIDHHTSNYIAVYTGLAFEPRPDTTFEGANNLKRSGLDMMSSAEYQFVLEGGDDNTTNGTQPNWFQQYFPGWFWEAALMFVLVFPWVLVGYFQLMGVQVPEHFVIKAKKSS